MSVALRLEVLAGAGEMRGGTVTEAAVARLLVADGAVVTSRGGGTASAWAPDRTASQPATASASPTSASTTTPCCPDSPTRPCSASGTRSASQPGTRPPGPARLLRAWRPGPRTGAGTPSAAGPTSGGCSRVQNSAWSSASSS